MQVRGDLEVKRTGIFDRRADEGLNDESISTSLSLTRHSARYQLLNSTSGNNLVILPDATTLPNGWAVEIFNDGDTALQVQDDQDSGTFDDIAVNGGNRYILLNNGTAQGTWYVEPMETSATAKYSDTFDATTDWGSASGGYYTITYLASTHGKGTTPSYQIEITDGGTGYNRVEVDQVNVNASGDIAFRVPEDPDLRFAGRITVI